MSSVFAQLRFPHAFPYPKSCPENTDFRGWYRSASRSKFTVEHPEAAFPSTSTNLRHRKVATGKSGWSRDFGIKHQQSLDSGRIEDWRKEQCVLYA